jgi:cell wall-associated NlpC family hydrolase
MVEYASRFIGQPYLWGGNGPMYFDCSGFILEVLKGFGRVDNKLDMTAKDLHRYLLDKSWKPALDKGSILFFGRELSKISHVGIAINKELYISAAAGDSTTTTLKRAQEQSAFIKLRPIRSDLVSSLLHPDDANSASYPSEDFLSKGPIFAS